MKTLRKTFIIIGCIGLFTSCFDTKQIEQDLGAINDSMKIIQKKIDDLEMKQKTFATDIATLKSQKNKNNSNNKGPDPNKVYDIAVAGSQVFGNPNAKVTITEWMDFQWPYCARSTGLVDDILKKYPNDVKVVIKNFPLASHKQAMKAAKYALASANQGKYSEMYHKILDNYRALKSNEDLPLQYAAELGMDIEKLKQDILDPALEQQIRKETNQMKNTDLRKSVPKFLINGREPAKRDLAGFSAMIDAELKKLKK